jgi:hypothetical protein
MEEVCGANDGLGETMPPSLVGSTVMRVSSRRWFSSKDAARSISTVAKSGMKSLKRMIMCSLVGLLILNDGGRHVQSLLLFFGSQFQAFDSCEAKFKLSTRWLLCFTFDVASVPTIKISSSRNASSCHTSSPPIPLHFHHDSCSYNQENSPRQASIHGRGANWR